MKAALRSIASVVAASAFVVAAGGGGRETPSKTEMNMALEIRPARTSYAPGDKIEIVCTVSNASTGVELFLPWTDGAGWLECRDRSSALVRPILLTLAEGAFEAGPKDFVLLRPGQTHIVTLHGQIVKGEITVYGEQNRKGMFLLFGEGELLDFAFELGGPGGCKVRAAYQFPNWVRVKKSELIDESRIYRRSIASPWVSLKVSN